MGSRRSLKVVVVGEVAEVDDDAKERRKGAHLNGCRLREIDCFQTCGEWVLGC